MAHFRPEWWLTFTGIIKLEGLDKKTRQLAIKYLTDGVNIGNYDCRHLLGQLYMDGKYLERDTLKGKELLKLAD